MARIEQVNELLMAELAILVTERINLDGGLITICYVECSPDLHYAKIGVSILPEKYFGSALEELKKQSSAFAKALKKKTRLRQIPHFNWQIDETEAKAAEIEELLRQI